MAQSAISLNLENSLFANQLDMPDKSKFVYDLTQGWTVFDLFVANRAKPRQIVGRDGIFQKAVMGTSAVTGVVQSAVVLGNGNLQVTFTTANTKFRPKTMIGDGSAAMNLGYCVSATGSQIELEPTTAIGSWNTATQFLANRTAVEITPASGDYNSTSPQPQFYIPEYYTNNTGIVREQMVLSRRDLHATWTQGAGGKYWAYVQEPKMINNFGRKLEMRSVWSQRSTVNSPLEGNVSLPKGLREAVLDPLYGGIYTPLANVFTVQQFDKFITDCALRTNCMDFTLFLGIGAMNAVQNFPTITAAIEFGGWTNTFGGKEVEGFNIPIYAVNGVKCTLMQAPIFNDPYYFPDLSTAPGAVYSRMAYTVVAVPNKDYLGSDGQMLPTVEKCYFGDKEIVYAIQNGVGIGSGPSAGSVSQTAPLVTQDTDSVSLKIYSDCCYDWMMYGGGWMELIV